MKYNIQQETTQWASPTTPNHVYIFEGTVSGRGAKAIGYVKAGTTHVQRFRVPMMMDTRGRTFVALK
jgi:hypothetical protein